MILISQDELLNRWDLLTENLREILFSSELWEMTDDLATQEKLDEDATSVLRRVVRYSLMGFVKQESLSNELEEALKIPKEKAKKIADYLTTLLLAPLKEELDSIGKTKEEKKKEPTKEEIAKLEAQVSARFGGGAPSLAPQTPTAPMAPKSTVQGGAPTTSPNTPTSAPTPAPFIIHSVSGIEPIKLGDSLRGMREPQGTSINPTHTTAPFERSVGLPSVPAPKLPSSWTVTPQPPRATTPQNQGAGTPLPPTPPRPNTPTPPVGTPPEKKTQVIDLTKL